MNAEKIDFTALDPATDGSRWEAMVQSVVSRALEARRQRLTIGRQLMVWARPVLIAAAVAAIAVWIGAMASPDPNITPSADEPALVLARWAEGDTSPSANEILEVLGGSHVEN